MSYQEVTQTSWGQRIGSTFKGALTGIILFFVGTGLLYWNEGNFIKTRNLIYEAAAAMVSVDNIDKLDASLNGKLIHATAEATTKEVLHDEEFGVNLNAIALNRDVEYYQWVEDKSEETRDKVGGGKETITTYTYRKEWTSSPVNSDIQVIGDEIINWH